MHSPLFKLHAHLYEADMPLFEGYFAEGKFEHGVDVVIGRIPALAPYGYSCVLFEARAPARFFSAELRRAGDERVLSLSTGSGEHMGALLYQLCARLVLGRLQLEEPQGCPPMACEKVFHQQNEDGMTARLYAAADGALKLEVQANSTLTPPALPATLYFTGERKLVEQAGDAFSQGMLVLRCALYG